MKGCLILTLSLAVLVLCGVVVFLALRQPEGREKLVFVETDGDSSESSTPNSETSKEQGQLSLLVEKVNELLQKQDEKGSEVDSGRAPTPETDEKKTFNQYFDADKAFAEDELFAVTSKRTIRRESYTDHFDKNPFGNPKTKFHPPVYILRAMGRETRENYLFIVTREFYDRAKIYQKFTKAELSNFEYFLSEQKLEREVFSRRFRGKMID